MRKFLEQANSWAHSEFVICHINNRTLALQQFGLYNRGRTLHLFLLHRLLVLSHNQGYLIQVPAWDTESLWHLTGRQWFTVYFLVSDSDSVYFLWRKAVAMAMNMVIGHGNLLCQNTDDLSRIWLSVRGPYLFVNLSCLLLACLKRKLWENSLRIATENKPMGPSFCKLR